MVIDRTDPFAPRPKPDPRLIKAIINAHRFNEKLLLHGRAGKFADLAKNEKLHRSYYSQVLRLAYLAPDIIAAILEGRQPSGLTATKLVEHPCRQAGPRSAACSASDNPAPPPRSSPTPSARFAFRQGTN